MKKEKQYSVKKLGIMVWVIVISAMILGIVSGAAYINKNSVKRVVSIQGSSGTAFSSNYLLALTGETYSIKYMSVPENENTASFDITVCNYAQHDPSRFNDKEIKYTLTLTLLDNSGTEITRTDSCSVACGDGISTSFSGSCAIGNQTLEENKKSVNTYTVKIPKAFVDDGVRIKAAAVPDNDSMGANITLGRIFAFKYAADSAMTWTGGFVETTAAGYDAFNYIIKGQGEGKITLSWDPTQLEINKIFLYNNSLEVTESPDNKKTITIIIDSNNNKNRYDIQFYKVEGGAYGMMDEVKKHVVFTFVESGNGE